MLLILISHHKISKETFKQISNINECPQTEKLKSQSQCENEKENHFEDNFKRGHKSFPNITFYLLKLCRYFEFLAMRF